MAFIAAYDKPDADAYEQHVTRVARTWLRILGAKYSVQGIVDRIMDDFTRPVPDDYGCGWQELRTKFTEWAIAEKWVKPEGDNPPVRRRERRMR